MALLDSVSGFASVSIGSAGLAVFAKIVHEFLVYKQTKQEPPRFRCESGTLEYWDRMQERVTDPIVKAIEHNTPRRMD